MIIFLGDPKQLRSTVKSYNTDDNFVNPFAKQMVISFFERLWSRNFETYIFTEQYRLAVGLEEVLNHPFYNGCQCVFAGHVELRLVGDLWATRCRTEPELPTAPFVLAHGSDAI